MSDVWGSEEEDCVVVKILIDFINCTVLPPVWTIQGRAKYPELTKRTRKTSEVEFRREVVRESRSCPRWECSEGHSEGTRTIYGSGDVDRITVDGEGRFYEYGKCQRNGGRRCVGSS